MIDLTHHAAPLPSGLTVSQLKANLFAVDTYFTEAYADIGATAVDPVEFAWQHGVMVLKPDAFVAHQAGTILDWLGDNGFVIATATPIRFDRHVIRALWRYQWNMATPERKVLQERLLLLEESLLLIVRSEVALHAPVTTRLTDLKGPAVVGNRQPFHLRYRLGLDSAILSFVHTADEPADVIRELGIHYTAEERKSLVHLLSERPVADIEARELALKWQERTPARDLSLAALLKRLNRSLPHQETDWRLLPQVCREAGIPFDQWDEIVLTAGHIDANLPGVDPLIRTSAKAWGEW